MLLPLISIVFLVKTFTAVIHRIPGKSIELSINNINEVSDYHFRFYIDNDTEDDYFLYIKFPKGDYTLPDNTACKAHITANLVGERDCTTLTDNWMRVEFSKISEGSDKPILVVIEDITNPNSFASGTGNFILEVRKGVYNLVEANHMFGAVGFFPAISFMDMATMPVVSGDKVDELSIWDLDITFNSGIQKIDEGARLTIELGDFIRTSDQLAISSTYQSDLDFSYTAHTITINGLNGSQSIAGIDFRIENLQNPYFSTQSGDFTIRLWQNYTNSVIQEFTISNSAFIAPYEIPNNSQNLILTNFENSSYIRTVNDQLFYEFTVKSAKTLIEGARIEIVFGVDFSLTECWPGTNLIGIDKTKPVTCTISANKAIVTNFKEIIANLDFSIGVEVTNPSATGPSNPITINVYETDISTNLLAVMNNIVITVDAVYKEYTTLQVASALTANTLETLSIEFETTDNILPATNKQFRIRLKKSDFDVVGSVSADLYENGVFRVNLPIVLSSSVDYVILDITDTTTTLNSAETHRIDIVPGNASSGIQTPQIAGKYPINLILTTDQAGVNYNGTILTELNSITLTIFTVDPVTLNSDHLTVYRIEFVSDVRLEKSYWVAEEEYKDSYIELLFYNTFSGNPAFRTDLGLGLSDGSTFPCYAFKGLVSRDSTNLTYLTCTLIYPIASHPNQTAVKVEGYNTFPTGGLVELFFPNVFNPANLAVAVPVELIVYQRQRSTYKQIITGSFTLPVMEPPNIFSNPNNSNGELGLPSTESPIYTPNKINKQSLLEIKFVPVLDLLIDEGFLFFLPELPQTTPQSFLLPQNNSIKCKMNGTYTKCLSFPEANLAIMYFSENMVKDQEWIFVIENCLNPSYVVNLEKSMKIWTFNTAKEEVEEIFFLDLPAFDYGEILYSKVRPRRYEALEINVQYEWVFIISNPIPVGGYITLYFPSNYYDNEHSVPCPVVHLKEGISWKNPENNPNDTKTGCIDIHKSSVTTINEINPLNVYSAFNTTLAVVWVDGVKNPSQEGWTPYFGISTHNSNGYIIDRLLEVQGIFVKRNIESGKITYKDFMCKPSNGQLKSNYYLNFWVSNDIPKNGHIKVVFPNTEFSAGFSETEECRVGGALKTYLRCEFAAGSAEVSIYLDEDLEIEPGMKPIELVFTGIRNFNADLSSGLVRVTTYYDDVILDDTSNDESNRRAVTTKEADTLVIVGFTVSPLNEATQSTISFSFDLDSNIENSHYIRLQFPDTFPYALTKQVLSKSNLLTIGELDPLITHVEERILYIKNFKPQDCPCTIDIEVTGVVLPNFEHNGSIGDISVFYHESEERVLAYNYNIGTITLVKNPAPLLSNSLYYSNTNSRVYSNYYQVFGCRAAVSYDMLRLSFNEDNYSFLLMTNRFGLSFKGITLSSQEIEANSFNLNLGTVQAIDDTTLDLLTLENVWTGYSDSTSDFILAELWNSSDKQVKCRSYSNLTPHPTLDFTKDKIIFRNDNFDTVTVNAGTYTNSFNIIASEPVLNGYIPNPITYDPYTTLPGFMIATSNESFEFRLGCDHLEYDRYTYISFNFDSPDVFPKKPIAVYIKAKQKNTIEVDNFYGFPSNGFVGPVKVTLSQGPYTSLILDLILINDDESILAVYPQRLYFNEGETEKSFFIFSYKSSRLSNGNLIIAISGQDSHIYEMKNGTNKIDFKLFDGKEQTPLLLNKSFKLNQVNDENFRIDFELEFNEQCLVYYTVTHRGTKTLDFNEMEMKKLNYDNIIEPIIFGTVIMGDDSLIINVSVDGLKTGFDYELKILYKNKEGNIGEAGVHQFSTINTDDPYLVVLEVDISSSTDFNSLYSELKNMSTKSQHYSSQYLTNQIEIFEDNIYILTKRYELIQTSFTEKPTDTIDEETMDPELLKKKEDLWNEISAFKNFLNKYESQFNPLTNFIPFVFDNYSEVYNKFKENMRESEIYTDQGVSQELFKEESTSQEILEKTKLYTREESYVYNSKAEYYSVFQPDYLYKKNRLSIINSSLKKYFKFYITPDSNSNALLEELATNVAAVRQSRADMTNYYVARTKRRDLRFSQINFPYIKKKTNSTVVIGGLAIEQPCDVIYSLIEPNRVEYKNYFNTNDSFLLFKNLNTSNLFLNCSSINADLGAICYQDTSNTTELLRANYTSADIRNYTRVLEKPTVDQMLRNFDANNFYAIRHDRISQNDIDTYFDLEIDQLQPNRNYTLFISLIKQVDGINLIASEADTFSFTFRTEIPEIVSTALISRVIISLIIFMVC